MWTQYSWLFLLLKSSQKSVLLIVKFGLQLFFTYSYSKDQLKHLINMASLVYCVSQLIYVLAVNQAPAIEEISERNAYCSSPASCLAFPGTGLWLPTRLFFNADLQDKDSSYQSFPIELIQFHVIKTSWL
jgi:hypothetical protein